MLNPKSTASIAGHPLHPMLVLLPIAFFVATFACNLVFWRTGGSFWASASIGFWVPVSSWQLLPPFLGSPTC